MEINCQIFTVPTYSSVIIHAPPLPPEQNLFDSILIVLPPEMISQMGYNVIQKY